MKETKVLCPKCGAEIKIAEKEYMTQGVVIGKDSGLGTVYLEEAKPTKNKAVERLEALKKAGIDTSGFFAMQTGDIARVNNGMLETVPQNDPIYSIIIDNGYIRDRRLFRRWVMAQMFHMLASGHSVTSILRERGLKYQWRVVEDELRTQMKMEHSDKENFSERNIWFNKITVHNMCIDYMHKLKLYVSKLKYYNRNGVEFVNLKRRIIRVSELNEKLYNPMLIAVNCNILTARNAKELYNAFVEFKKVGVFMDLDVSTTFIDSYKGIGAYYTMKNMILFHDCKFKTGTPIGMIPTYGDMEFLQKSAWEYAENGEGWRLFGMMKQFIKDNNINIIEKIRSWRVK